MAVAVRLPWLVAVTVWDPPAESTIDTDSPGAKPLPERPTLLPALTREALAVSDALEIVSDAVTLTWLEEPMAEIAFAPPAAPAGIVTVVLRLPLLVRGSRSWSCHPAR